MTLEVLLREYPPTGISPCATESLRVVEVFSVGESTLQYEVSLWAFDAC